MPAYVNLKCYTTSCSVAIMQYLCAKYKLPDHWYPADFTKKALVDQYLYWHTGNIRCKVFFLKVRMYTAIYDL